MFKKIVKGVTLFAAVLAVTFVSAKVVKATPTFDGCTNCGSPVFDHYSNSTRDYHFAICSCGGTLTNNGENVSGVHDYSSGNGQCTICSYTCTHSTDGETENGWVGIFYDSSNNEINCNWEDTAKHAKRCFICHKVENVHTYVRQDVQDSSNKNLYYVCCKASECGGPDTNSHVHMYEKNYSINKKTEEKKEEEPKEEKKEEPARDVAREAFGGRAPEALSVAEQLTAVSYALDNLRASGNALPANTVKTGSSSGGSSDIAAVVADNRDALNQQVFAQVMCQNLGFKNVTPLKTYNMYALHSTYDAKNKSQTITWANTGLKFGDAAFVVWYNQKLGKIELLPAIVGINGDVAVSVPALGDVSTMTVVKAN